MSNYNKKEKPINGNAMDNSKDHGVINGNSKQQSIEMQLQYVN